MHAAREPRMCATVPRRRVNGARAQERADRARPLASTDELRGEDSLRYVVALNV